MTERNGSKRELRSQAWFSGLNMFTFSHRSWNGRGYPPDVFDGRPVVGPVDGIFFQGAFHCPDHGLAIQRLRQ